MKTWQSILLGALLALISAAAIYLIALPPRGTPVELLPPPTPAPILVDVSGAVNHPGVYTLQPGSRVQDAVVAAGGLAALADGARVNQAKKLSDGEKLTVPTIGETPAANSGEQADPGGDTSAAIPTGPININTATQEELDVLPGIGPSRALDIIAYREKNGGFKTPEELQNVTGIGEATFERLRDLVTVE